MNINRFLWIATTTLFFAIGGLLGYGLGLFYTDYKVAESPVVSESMRPLVIFAIVCGMAIVFARIGASVGNKVSASFSNLNQMSAADRVLGICGLLLGLTFGLLITFPLVLPEAVTNAWTVPLVKLCIMTVSAMLGVGLLQGMRGEMLRVFPVLDENAEPDARRCSMKFLDTNVIIDGRIADLCRTGFIEGPVFVPSFVLHELQYIADSSDSLRRARGRRGLETLNVMRSILLGAPNETPQPAVEVITDIPASVARVETVDAKLVALAKLTSGSILTNDYNLNRVAELQGVTVLNLNQLALALKPVVLPGEELTITIVREGKEAGQGVGYLEDGTMVVVNDGRGAIGETRAVSIVQVLQTVAGKMIFAELHGSHGSRSQDENGDSQSRQEDSAGGDIFSEKTQANSGESNRSDDARNNGRPQGRNDFSDRSGGGVRRPRRAER